MPLKFGMTNHFRSDSPLSFDSFKRNLKTHYFTNNWPPGDCLQRLWFDTLDVRSIQVVMNEWMNCNCCITMHPQAMHIRGYYVFTMSRCSELPVSVPCQWTRPHGGRVHYTYASAEASYDRPVLMVKVKVWTLAMVPLTWVRLVTSSALQSRK